MPIPSCDQLKSDLQALKSTKQDFKDAIEQSIKTGDLTKSRTLRTKLEKQIQELKDKLWLFETLDKQELKNQYDFQFETFKNLGIIEKLSNNEYGIKAIDNKEYTFPSFNEILDRLRQKQEELETKSKQGFSKLIITPFGIKLDDLIDKYKQVILEHKKDNKLLATKQKPSDPDEYLELDINNPIWVWDKYNNADINNELIYYPEKFDKIKHKGKTKSQLLEQNQAFNIILIEDLPNIPRQNKEKTINKRKQLGANQTPKKYLETIQTDKNYKNESGMTIEDQIIYAITHLEKTNQVIDDYQGNGSISYQLGAYFPVSGDVPNAYWNRDNQQANLSRNDPDNQDSVVGCRLAVRI